MSISIFLSVILLLIYFNISIRLFASAFLLYYVYFSQKKIKIIKALLLFSFTFLLVFLTEGVITSNTLSFGFKKEEITRVTGYVIQDSTKKKFNNLCQIELVECNVKSGAVSTGQGVIYVSFLGKDALYASDLVSFDGSFKDFGFSANSYFVRKRPSYNLMREKVLTLFKSAFPFTDEGHLSLMLLLGLQEDAEYPLSQKARGSGTSFVLALSGMHIGLFSFLLGLLLKPLFGRRNARIISFVLLSFYLLLIGPKPSLVRALLLSLIFYLHPSSLGIEKLLVAFLLQLILFPLAIISISAVFSYLSLSGILAFYPYFTDKIDSLYIMPRALSPFILTLSAIIYTVPFSYLIFGQYQLSALCTSFFISLLIYLYMVFSLLVLIIPSFSFLLTPIYKAISFLMDKGAIVEMQTTIYPYLILLFVLLLVVLLSSILSSRRRNICGALTMTVQKR